MKNLACTLVFIFIAVQLHAQKSFKFGKISKSELTKTESKISPDAHAEVLGEYGKLFFTYNSNRGIYFVLKYTKRIKIYDESGYDYANVSIPIYDGTGTAKESVKSLKGNVYNLVNGIVEKTSISKTDILEEEVTTKYTLKKVTFPKVKAGSVRAKAC